MPPLRNFHPDRVAHLDRRLAALLVAAKQIGFNAQDADDISDLFEELRLYADGVNGPARKYCEERLSKTFLKP